MEQISLSLKRRISICTHVLGVAARTRPLAMAGYFAGALVEISSSILSIYATARLGALLARFAATGQTDGIWLWLWADIASIVGVGLGFLLMNFSKRMLYFSFVRWSINNLLSALCRMDLANFYDAEMRNQLNRVSGSYIWQMPNLTEICLDLLYGLLRFLAITAVVSQITWWIVPLIALFLIPTLIGESRLAKMQWFVWDSKGDFRHIFWGLEYTVRQAKGQMELRSSQAARFVLNKIDRMNFEFYHEQESKFRHASRLLIPTKILEVAGTAVGSIVVLRQFLLHSISLERYFFLSGALLRIGGALNSIFGTLSRMQESLLFADSYFKIVDTKSEIVDVPDASSLPRNKVPSIEFKDVSFTYPGQAKPVFEGLNITIDAGEHVALVGENGAGKSTLIKLLLRFYRPTSGTILVDGK